MISPKLMILIWVDYRQVMTFWKLQDIKAHPHTFHVLPQAAPSQDITPFHTRKRFSPIPLFQAKSNIGTVYKEQGDITGALQQFEKALELLEKTGKDKEGIALYNALMPYSEYSIFFLR